MDQERQMSGGEAGQDFWKPTDLQCWKILCSGAPRPVGVQSQHPLYPGALIKATDETMAPVTLLPHPEWQMVN